MAAASVGRVVCGEERWSKANTRTRRDTRALHHQVLRGPQRIQSTIDAPWAGNPDNKHSLQPSSQHAVGLSYRCILTEISQMPRWRPTHRVISILFLISCLSLVNAQDECILEVDGVKYDLASARGEHSASRTRDTPPSTMRDAVRFDLCAELGTLDGVDEADQVR